MSFKKRGEATPTGEPFTPKKKDDQKKESPKPEEVKKEPKK